MKKYIALFVTVTTLAAVSAYATEQKTDFKRCFKLCMKELDDKAKCEFICDDSIKP